MTSARVVVISLSDSFSEFWPQLTAVMDAELEVGTKVTDIRALQSACAVIVSAGGVETDALETLQELRAAEAPDTAVAGVETDYRVAVTMTQHGATNYFALPNDLGLCRTWLSERIEQVVDRRNAAIFAAEERKRYDFSRIIGDSPLLQAALKRTAKVIPRTTTTVLITGETGTGKELIARAIHYNGARAAGPFVEINCTTLPDNLLEAELFGYESGAFTDARSSKPGLFEVADGGTLFLDEVGDLPSMLQAKLLRALEEKRIRRLGSVREMKIDVRLVAATNVNLPAAVQSGAFRSDLYYRLNVVPITLPPLRERGDDVILLAEHFLEKFCRHYEMQKPRLPPDVKRALRSHSWPGNVRELRNAIERALVLGDGEIAVEDLLLDGPQPPQTGMLPFPASMRAIEKAAAHAMVERCKGNKSEAAKMLEISRKHLYTLLEEDG